MYDAMMAETIRFTGHGGDVIEGYLARPLGPGPYGSVVVIHHMPGYDAETKEITRTFAVHGYLALCPNLYYREAPGASPDDAAAAARAQGGVPDERLVGDVGGAAAYLRAMPVSNGKVGRDRLLLGRAPVVPRRGQPAAGRRRGLLRRRSSSAPRPRASRCKVRPDRATWPRTCPARCSACSAPTTSTRRRTQVAELDKALTGRQGPRVPHLRGAGHAFFAVDRPAYRPEAAMDGWQQIWDFYGRHLAG